MEKMQCWGKGASSFISSPVVSLMELLLCVAAPQQMCSPSWVLNANFYVFSLWSFFFFWFNSLLVKLAYAEYFAFFYDLWLFNSFYVFNNSLMFYFVVLKEHWGNVIIYHFVLLLGPGCGGGSFHSQSCTACIWQKRLKLHQVKLLHSYKSTLDKLSLKSSVLWIY